MADQSLSGMRVAILATDGFEQSELLEPREALTQAGAEPVVVAPRGGLSEGQVRGWNHTEWGETVASDLSLEAAEPAAFDALVLPGGVFNPDKLRMNPKAVAFVKAFFDAGKPVAAICHGPWTVLEAGAAKGRRMTSWPSLKTDLKNAGAEWVDQETVLDNGLLTSRKPDDIPAFNRAMIKLFAQARGKRHAA